VVIVNNQSTVHIAARVLDAKGHLLTSDGVRFRRIGGAPISISASGNVTCKARGDADVRLSVGRLSHDIVLRCQPIRQLLGFVGGDLVAGDLPTKLSLSAIGPDGRPVELIALSAQVQDSEIASLDGLNVQPKAPGTTEISVWAGDQSMSQDITVHTRGSSPATLAVGDGFATLVRLHGGETQQWSMPYLRRYYVALTAVTTGGTEPSGHPQRDLVDDRAAQPEPRLAIINANCHTPGPEQGYLCVSLDNSELIVRAPAGAPASEEFEGHLIVVRLRN
jgi:hypothetical protein